MKKTKALIVGILGVLSLGMVLGLNALQVNASYTFGECDAYSEKCRRLAECGRKARAGASSQEVQACYDAVPKVERPKGCGACASPQ